MTQHNACQNGNESDRMIEDDDDFDDSQDQFQHPQQRNAANARERARMRVLSKAFCRLKTTLPWVPPDTKLSKLDTLRLATSYIAHLRAILKLSENDPTDRNIHPVNMSWPFNFNANWDSNSKHNEQLTAKTDWNVQKHCSNDVTCDTSYDMQCSRKYPINRYSKTRQKNPLYFCQMDPESNIRSNYDSEVKSYGYYG